MGSRLLPLSLALGALAADAAGLHQIGSYLVLLAILGAAAAAFVAAADVLDGKRAWLRAGSTGLALALLVVGSAVRASAPAGAHVPAVTISALVSAILLYLLPVLGWLLEPVAPRPRPVRVPAVER